MLIPAALGGRIKVSGEERNLAFSLFLCAFLTD